MANNIRDFEDAGTAGPITVSFTYLDEGYHGDYDPTDPTDKPLYRVDVTVNDEHPDAEPSWTADDHIEAWGDTITTTWCTNIVAGLPDVNYPQIAQQIADHLNNVARDTDGKLTNLGRSIAHVSWWSVDDHTSPFDRFPGQPQPL